MARRGFKRLARVSGAQIGAIASVTWVCPQCGVHHKGKKPAQCMNCGRMDFTRFDSALEARHWALLLTLERHGKIKNLRRQVSFDLRAFNYDNELAAVVARYICDFVYEDEEGRLHLVDTKGAITDVASLKLRFMAAMGLPVEIVS